jgi:hypothetical protein
MQRKPPILNRITRQEKPGDIHHVHQPLEIPTMQDKITKLNQITVNDHDYIAYNDMLTTVAQKLGEETAFDEIMQATNKTLQDLGFLPPVQLYPPDVPFPGGQYCQSIIELPTETITDALAQLAHKSSVTPELIIRLNHLMLNIFKRSGLSGEPTQTIRDIYTNKTIKVAKSLEWSITDDNRILSKHLPFNTERAREGIATLILGRNGSPISAMGLLREAVWSGYDQWYDLKPNEVQPIVIETINEQLVANNYETEPKSELYHPLPIKLDTNVVELLSNALGQLTTYNLTQYTNTLYRNHVKDTAEAIVKQTLSLYEFNNLCLSGPIGQALISLGYNPTAEEFRREQIEHPTPTALHYDFFFTKAVEIYPGNNKLIMLAKDMAVNNPILLLDETEETIILMQMVGPQQAVKANWAALMGGKKKHRINSVIVKLSGAENHVTLKKTLPCGWLEMWLIHVQASATEMTPGQPFYIIINETTEETAVPPTFFFMLNKSLSIPILPEWERYLWLSGRESRLIQPCKARHCHGSIYWLVIPDHDAWSNVITDGLSNGRIQLSSSNTGQPKTAALSG